MKNDGEEDTCLDCHGGEEAREKMIEREFLKLPGNLELADIEAELKKPYAHPVLTVEGVHRRYEALPEEEVTAPRHSECVDCHAPHVLENDRPFRGLQGRRVGNFIAEIEKEYELCYKCHGESANLPGTSTNKQEEFRETNPSFHPVEAEGRRAFSISLKEPYVARAERPGDVSQISCRDCHGSDDPEGPSGPHGSAYPGLLVKNYEMRDGFGESEFAYALCYTCHERSSILGDESFPYHSLHIEGGDPFTPRTGTSCFTCHDAHGSTVNPSLIRFNELVVEPNADGKLEYRAEGVGTARGFCLLNCHGVEHDEGENRKGY